MGHRDYKTTLLYADFAPDPSQGAGWAEEAFGQDEDDEGEPPEEDSSETGASD